jgi:hypothetical protein
MGASWVILGCIFAEWLLTDHFTALIASRKQEYVWKKGNPDSLFWKLLYMRDNLPNWIRPQDNVAEMHLENLQNHSVIDGESTNKSIGAGGRRQIVLLDEFARVDYSDAELIQETLSDTTPCRVFNSTPFLPGHPYSTLRFSGKVDVFEMPWYKHPWKSRGLYISRDLNYIEILDINYYRDICPEAFKNIKQNKDYKYSDLTNELLLNFADDARLKNIKFIADGKNKYRSPWYDREDERRSSIDMARNVDMQHIGAAESVFDLEAIRRIIEDYSTPEAHRLDIQYSVYDNKISDIKVTKGSRKAKLLWWSELYGLRPQQGHNYIISCDIALGTGASNSVATVYDTNTNEKVGCYIDAFISPEEFANTVYAIAKWVGGASTRPFLIFEGNGVGGIFD